MALIREQSGPSPRYGLLLKVDRLVHRFLSAAREQVNQNHDHGRVEQKEVPYQVPRTTRTSFPRESLTCWGTAAVGDTRRRSIAVSAVALLSTP